MSVYGYDNQRLAALRAGSWGVKDTLWHMAKMAADGKVDPSIRQLAIKIVKSVPGKDWRGECEAVQRWVKHNVRYMRDIAGVETIQSPAITVKLGAGDCDDQSVLVGALLGSMGFDIRFVAIGQKYDEYNHVFAEALIPGEGWVTVETTEPVSVGWQPQYVSRMEKNVK